jgi:tRNA guanosine-2'-O-methyltransferase
MVIFSKTSCLVFWLKNMENMDLPYSVKGKLGGPSQRRLPTSITSSVLHGVRSILTDNLCMCNMFYSTSNASLLVGLL